jgi:hypothetical protein
LNYAEREQARCETSTLNIGCAVANFQLSTFNSKV